MRPAVRWEESRAHRDTHGWRLSLLLSLQSCTYLQTTASVLLYRILLSNYVVYLMEFGDVLWEQGKRNLIFWRDSLPLREVIATVAVRFLLQGHCTSFLIKKELIKLELLLK